MPWSCFYERCLGSRSGRSMEIFRLHSADRTNNSHCEWRQLFPPHRRRGVPESAMNPRAAHTNPRVNSGVEPRTRCALKIPCEFGHAYKTVVNNVFAYQFKMRDGSFPAWVWYVRATEPLYSLYHRLPMTCWLASRLKFWFAEQWHRISFIYCLRSSRSVCTGSTVQLLQLAREDAWDRASRFVRLA